MLWKGAGYMIQKVNRSIILSLITFLVGVLSCVQKAEETDNAVRFLFLDERNILSVQNARLVVGKTKKSKLNPLFEEDKPWEKRFDNLYGNVIYDQQKNLYRCWYSPFIVDSSAKGMSFEARQKPYNPPYDREMAICYAFSKDGINWVKPEMGLVDYNGSKNNNLIWRKPHGAGIFLDPNEKDPRKKYKTIFQGISVSSSPDGFNWEEEKDIMGVDVAGDTHNNAFWAPTLNKYVGITRSWSEKGEFERGKRIRQVSRIESADFLNWTKEEVVLEGENFDDQIYAMPVFFYAGVYIGLPVIYSRGTDKAWTELAYSTDTKKWKRISPGVALIPNSEKVLDYDYGCVYACANPVFLKNEIRLYYGASDYLHFGWRNGSLCLASLRPDGFAGFEQIELETISRIKTKLINIENNNIQVTTDIDDDGWLLVKVYDSNGVKILTSEKIVTTTTDGLLSFGEKIGINEIQLEFEFKKAKLYSFSFSD